MPLRLRVGVIGLGRNSLRYQAALHRLRDQFEVRCVYDQRPQRGEVAARRLGCGVAAGPTDLLERPEVDALLLLDRQWFGLWPLTVACRFGKPAFCAPSLIHETQADGLREKLAAGEPFVHMALPPTVTQAMLRARALLKSRLGPAQLVRCDWMMPRREKPAAMHGLRSPVMLSFLSQCADLFQAAPTAVSTTATQGAGFASVFLNFEGCRVAQVSLWNGFGQRSDYRVQVVGESGSVEAELPSNVRWQDREGWHMQRLPGYPARQRLLERFSFAVRNAEKPRTDFACAYRALTWQRAAVQSLEEGKKVALGV
jgi:predicted dehydrogenase